MTIKSIEAFVRKVAEADVLFRDMETSKQGVGLTVLVSLCKRYEILLGQDYTNRTITWYNMKGVEDFFDMLYRILLDRDLSNETETEAKYKQYLMQFTDKMPDLMSDTQGLIHSEDIRCSEPRIDSNCNNCESGNKDCEPKHVKCMFENKGDNFDRHDVSTSNMIKLNKHTLTKCGHIKDKDSKIVKNENNLNFSSIKKQLLHKPDSDMYNITEECLKDFTYVSDEFDLESNITDSGADRRKRKQSFPKRTVLPLVINLKTLKTANTIRSLTDDVIGMDTDEGAHCLKDKTSDNNKLVYLDIDNDNDEALNSSCDTNQELNLNCFSPKKEAREGIYTFNENIISSKESEIGSSETVTKHKHLKTKANSMQSVKMNPRKKLYKICKRKANLQTRNLSTKKTNSYKYNKGRKVLNRKRHPIFTTHFAQPETNIKSPEDEAPNEDTIKCKSCDMQFPSAHQCNTHMVTHTVSATYSACNANASTGDKRRGSKRKTRRTKARSKLMFECSFCDKKYSKESSFEVHMRLHTGEKPYECGECKLYFRTSKALGKHRKTNSHLIKAGDAILERKYLCHDCGKAYFKKFDLQRHMRFHRGEKQHMCQFCGYKCQEANNLKRHMALHFESQRNFVCEICGAAFHAKKTLETHHQYKHSDERNFKCDDCSLTFKAISALKRHIKVHNIEKDHPCWCGAAFKRMYNLRRHLRGVHGTDDVLPPVKHVTTLDCLKKLPISKTDHTEELESSSDINQLLKNIEQTQSTTVSRSCDATISETNQLPNKTENVFDHSYNTQQPDIETGTSFSSSHCIGTDQEPLQSSLEKNNSLEELPEQLSSIHENSVITTPSSSNEMKVGSLFLPHLTSVSEHQSSTALPQMQFTPKVISTEGSMSPPRDLSALKEYTMPSLTNMQTLYKKLTHNFRLNSSQNETLIPPVTVKSLPTPSERLPRLSFMLNSDISSRFSASDLAVSHLQKLTHDHQKVLQEETQNHPKALHENVHHDHQKALHDNSQVHQNALNDDLYSRLAQEELTQRLIQDSQRMSHTDFLQRLSPTEYGFPSKIPSSPANAQFESYPAQRVASVICNNKSLPPEGAAGEFSSQFDESDLVHYHQSRRELAAESLAQMAGLVQDPGFISVPSSQVL